MIDARLSMAMVRRGMHLARDPSFLATDPNGPADILEPGASVTILKLRQQ
jgi:hypothetical protein